MAQRTTRRKASGGTTIRVMAVSKKPSKWPTKERHGYWVQGFVAKQGVWHDLYGPFPRYTEALAVKRACIVTDPSPRELEMYEDFQLREVGTDDEEWLN